MGTIVNTLTVIIGSLIGLLFKKGIKPDQSEQVVKVMGVCSMLVGLTGVLSTMGTVEGSKISFSGTLMLIISMALGSIVGSKLDIDKALNGMGARLEARFNLGDFSKGFINASLLFCIGAMTIVGSFNDGIAKDHSILYLKSALDGITSIFLSASMGIGVMFSAAAIFVIQGSLTLMAVYLKPVMGTPIMINSLCMVGYAIVTVIGLNMMEAVKIKTANLLPSLIVPIAWVLMGISVI